MKKLIITEKPSVARDFARVLHVSGNGDGCIENSDYVISWCYGHLVGLVYPEDYDARYKKWDLADLPFLPKDYKYGVIESAAKQYGVVNRLLHREDIDTVYWAGDSGKEGQTIEENIRMYGGVREGMTELRVWIDSQTDEEIQRGIAEAKPMAEYALLGKSGIMRTIEDYALGINFSRALSVKYGRLINDAAATSSYTAIAMGRVMTCVLGMVVRREREIRNFTETPFYRVMGNFADVKFNGEWRTTEQSKYYNSPLLYSEKGFKKRESAEGLMQELAGVPAVVDACDIGTSRKKAPLLFNLAELQAECSKRFKISPDKTLETIQSLYEKKYTTYPRTDARVLTTAVAKEIHKNISRLSGYAPVAGFVKNIMDNKSYIGIEKTAYTDDSKVTDHYAIIPTGYTNGLDNLGELEKKVYDLICRRFLAIFYPNAEYKTVKIQLALGNEKFFTSAKVLTKPGYMEVSGIPQAKESKDGDEEEEEQTCSKEDLIAFAQNLKKGDTLPVNGFEIKEGKTKPPKRYTSGNLILAMENAGNLIEDEELREQIKNTGIGTSATRGEILAKLVRIGYLNLNEKTQIITPEKLGEMIYEVAVLTCPSLLNPDMTASWEKGLEGIIDGSVDADDYRAKLENYIRTETNKMIASDLNGELARNINQFTTEKSKGAATRKPLGIPCPLCGGELTTTAFGYGCSNYWNEDIKCKFNVGSIAGCDLTEEEFRQLMTEGKTEVIDRFVSKSKKKFKARLVLKKDPENKEHPIGAVFDFNDVPAEAFEGATCPACGSKLVRTGFGVACEKRTREGDGCYFGIGEIAGKKLDDDTIKTLLTTGTTDVIRGFKAKNKTSFNAKLKLATDENGKKNVAFDFEGVEADAVPDVVCPDCGGKINIKSWGYGCSNFNGDDENSCKFSIGKIAGKALSVKNVQKLLAEGKTDTIRGFKGKSGKKFDAILVLKKDENGKTQIAFDFDNVEKKYVKDVKCPLCGGGIVKTSFGYGCENYDFNDKENSCRFNIGKIAGVSLNDSQVTELLTKGITEKLSGFRAKSGNKFEACLALGKDDSGKVTGVKFVFPDETKVIEGVECPICQGKVIKNHFGYKCEHNLGPDQGCKFFIGKVAGVELTEDQITQLLNEKHTDEIQGFLSKKGNLFSAKLKLDEQFRAAFDFESNNTATQAPTAETPAPSPAEASAPVAPETPEVVQEASTPAPASSADDDLAAFLAAEEAAVDVDLEHELFG